MGQIDLGRVQGHSISQINRVGSSGNIDTYEVKLEDNTSAGQFTVTNGIDGTNGINGKDGKDGAPGKDGTLVMVNGELVETFDADLKSELPIDSLASSETKIPLSANMGRKLDIEKAPNAHASAEKLYGVSDATHYGHSKASSMLPSMNGVANAGTDNGNYAREGHVHPTDSTRAAVSHTHSASDISTGIFPVSRGGTGKTSFTSGQILVGNGTGAFTSISQSSMSVGYAVSAGSANSASSATSASRATTADNAARASRADNATYATRADTVDTNVGNTKFRAYDISWAPGKDDARYPINTGISVRGATVSAKSKSYYGAGPVLAIEKSGSTVTVVVDNDAGDLAGFCLIVWGV